MTSIHTINAHLETIERRLAVFELDGLKRPLHTLLENVQSAHEAFGEIYTHPAAEVVDILLNTKPGTHTTAQSKLEQIAHEIAFNTSLGTMTARCLNLDLNKDDVWLPQYEPYSRFAARHNTSPRLLNPYKETQCQSLYDWIITEASTRH